jgi:hypothetical protein
VIIGIPETVPCTSITLASEATASSSSLAFVATHESDN